MSGTSPSAKRARIATPDGGEADPDTDSGTDEKTDEKREDKGWLSSDEQQFLEAFEHEHAEADGEAWAAAEAAEPSPTAEDAHVAQYIRDRDAFLQVQRLRKEHAVQQQLELDMQTALSLEKEQEAESNALKNKPVKLSREEHKKQIAFAVHHILTQPVPPSASLITPYSLGSGLCILCNRLTVEQDSEHDLCVHNKAVLQWADQCPPDISQLGHVALYAMQAGFSTYVAAVLIERKKYDHLSALLRVSVSVINHDVFCAVVSHGDAQALEAIRRHWRGDLASFYTHAWSGSDTEEKSVKTSILHAAIAGGQVDFLIAQCWNPLVEAVGDEQAHLMLRKHATTPMDTAPMRTPVQHAIHFQNRPLLQLLCELKYERPEHSPVYLATNELKTLPALWHLVKMGASLYPIWPVLRSDPKLYWLLNAILDTFFEQGLRCRAARCFIHKLSSPSIHITIVAFLWRDMRRVSAERAAAIGDRHKPTSKPKPNYPMPWTPPIVPMTASASSRPVPVQPAPVAYTSLPACNGYLQSTLSPPVCSDVSLG